MDAFAIRFSIGFSRSWLITGNDGGRSVIGFLGDRSLTSSRFGVKFRLKWSFSTSKCFFLTRSGNIRSLVISTGLSRRGMTEGEFARS